MYKFIIQDSLPSVLWRCWLGGRKGIWPVKSEWWGAGVVVCLEQGADLHMAQLMSWPLTVSCFIKIQTGFTFPVPTYPGSCRKRAVKRVCVCVCVTVCFHPNFLLQSGTLITKSCHLPSACLQLTVPTDNLIIVKQTDKTNANDTKNCHQVVVLCDMEVLLTETWWQFGNYGKTQGIQWPITVQSF